MLNREQIAAIQNVTLDYLFELGNKAVVSVGKLLALNNQWTARRLSICSNWCKSRYRRRSTGTGSRSKTTSLSG
ncbi:hypothetical protein OKW32_000396 [Paraburkholderia youngii]